MQPTALIILDGFGYNPNTQRNAIALAKTPFLDMVLKKYPWTTLIASGTSVGLLPNQIGNSEVGHLIIGAGRIIEQDITRIHKSITEGSFFKNPQLVNNLKKLATTKKRLHIMGLLSDAGVHSHEYHLYAFLQAAQEQHISQMSIHVFADGRDTPPKSATEYLNRVDEYCTKHRNTQLSTISGRFYAMDRDQNWQRTETTYQTLTTVSEIQFDTWRNMLSFYYEQQITDEFIPPTQLKNAILIESGDGIIFINFRPERAQQLAAAFTQSDFDKFQVQKMPLAFFITPTDYHDETLAVQSMFPAQPIINTLKDVLSNNGKTIFSIAESEKYAHVTYFFNGMTETPVKGEERMVIPSIKTETYAQYPCMSAAEITSAIKQSLADNPKDFYLINFANADMVAHSGNLEAVIKAIECLDNQLQQLYNEIVIKRNGTLYITGDHGNAEDMTAHETAQFKTAHTINPVYFVAINQDYASSNATLHLESLKDIAPFILRHMNIVIPTQMI